MIYFCCEEDRRELVRAHPTLIGIDHLEVVDSVLMPAVQRQRTLIVHLIEDGATAFPVKDGYAATLTATNVIIQGGERVRDVKVLSVAVPPATPRVLTVTVDHPGDFSTYTLRIGKSQEDPSRLPTFDPVLSAVDFSFKVECENDFDCLPERVCPPELRESPDIDRLAKDYASFRRLMLDRMAVTMPEWRERSAPDLGVTLVELLAYVADHFSYRQDAVATEAYLGTARRRTSVRRHARLVDYTMHDGCNARVWVHVQVSSDTTLKPVDDATKVRTRFLTRGEGPPRIDDAQLGSILRRDRPEVFEPIGAYDLVPANNQASFYTWGDRDCCLPKGATRATLKDKATDRLRLVPGDVLVFEERLGPETGNEADADPAKRHAVRLTAVEPSATVQDQGGVTVRTAGPPLTDPLTDQPIVEIGWDAADALPFPLCVSATSDSDHGQKPLDDVSVAVGNVVLADHGMTIFAVEPLGQLPEASLFVTAATGGDRCHPSDDVPVPPRFKPVLAQRPLTQAVPYEPDRAPSAYAALNTTVRNAVPAISLSSELDGRQEGWSPRRDLLNSKRATPDFVVEVESDLAANVRFGDDVNGKRPASRTSFEAVYRVGNGVRGNVGRDAIARFVASDAAIESVRNPLPASGGVEPESIEDVRQYAPAAFRTQERAVTAADYAAVTERHPEIQRAAATFRWTGSWRTVFVTTDRIGGLVVDAPFEAEMVAHIEPFRMAGQDLEIDEPRHVPLEISMVVCTKADYFRSDVKQALLEVFSSRTLPDGRRGVFHPDNFTFGQSVWLSQLYAAAEVVDGVDSVEITQFERKGRPSPLGLQTGALTFARLEIPQLENDANFQERGVFHLTMQGGK